MLTEQQERMNKLIQYENELRGKWLTTRSKEDWDALRGMLTQVNALRQLENYWECGPIRDNFVNKQHGKRSTSGCYNKHGTE